MGDLRHYHCKLLVEIIMNVEEEFLDVLQNIEAAIQIVYRENANLLDYDVESALNMLMVDYQHEQKTNVIAPQKTSSAELKIAVYQAVRAACEFRMGRGARAHQDIEPLELSEILACLKRIRKSVQTWTRRDGRQGYLNFVSEFV